MYMLYNYIIINRSLQCHLETAEKLKLSLTANGINSLKEYNSIINDTNTIENDFHDVNVRLMAMTHVLQHQARSLGCEFTNIVNSIAELGITKKNDEKRANEEINAIDEQIESLKKEIACLEKNKSEMNDVFEKQREKHDSDCKKVEERVNSVVIELENCRRSLSNVTEFKSNEQKQFSQTLCEIKQACNNEYKQLIKNWQKWNVETTKEFLHSAIDHTMTDRDQGVMSDDRIRNFNLQVNNYDQGMGFLIYIERKNDDGKQCKDKTYLDLDSNIDVDKFEEKNSTSSKYDYNCNCKTNKKDIYKLNIAQRCNIEGKDLAIVNSAVLKVMGVNNQDDCQKLIVFIKKCILDSCSNGTDDQSNCNDMDHDEFSVLNRDGDMCIICVESKANMVYTDCGHMSLCQGCYHEWSKDKTYCPQCRKESNKAIKVFVTGYCQ